MRSICHVPECTRLVPRISALFPLPQAATRPTFAENCCAIFSNTSFFVAFPTPNKCLLSSHVEIKKRTSASPHRSRLFPGCTYAQVLANTQFRPMRSMNKKVQRRRQKKLHAKNLYWKFKRTELQFSAKFRLHGHGSAHSCSARAVYQTHKYMAISTPVPASFKI